MPFSTQFRNLICVQVWQGLGVDDVMVTLRILPRYRDEVKRIVFTEYPAPRGVTGAVGPSGRRDTAGGSTMGDVG